jgi:hypothetical protein
MAATGGGAALITERERWEREARAFYAQHSPMTDPGRYSDWLIGLPEDIAALHRIANGLVIHFRLDDPVTLGISKERLSETENRYAETIFGRLLELDQRPLTEHRTPQHRAIGCCRDFTVVFLAMARTLGLPARARVGFATYFFNDARNDHEVAEVWDAQDCRWRLVDPQLKDGHVDPNDGAKINPTDVPRDRFLTAGLAWERCRAGTDDPETFVVRPDIDVAIMRGWAYIAHNMVFDLAALNRMELLLWDLWGLAGRVLHGKALGSDEQELLERVAQVVGASEPRFGDLRTLYENEILLRVPEKVLSISPTLQGPREVLL